MTTLYINNFKGKHQDRVTLVKLLVEYQPGIGLKRAKEKMDDMINGVPIEIGIENSLLAAFQIQLEKLNLDFAIQD
jgi:hypothetical protein